MVWSGRWDPSKDSNVNTKDERAFKEYFRDKYERKKWYTDPSEIRKSKTPDPVPQAAVISPPSKVLLHV